MEGVVIGQYRVTKKLGEGGMGAVYAAEHSLLGRKAAIKMLLPALSQNQEIVQRFFNEARAATAIQDPGIVQIFDFGYHTDGSAYIVMEYLDGEPLDARLKRLGRLNPFDALRLMRQASSSLAAAHARGIIHRDLKPENIYLVVDREVSGGERPKLLDFGIAKLTNDTESKIKTHTTAIMGTPMYMSPEQCRGAGQVDARSDVYALGCVIFHLITGRTPFDGEGVGEIIASHLREPAPSPSQFVPGLPPEVDQLVARCLAKDPAARFQSATELADAIGWMLGQGGQPLGAVHPSAQFPASPAPTTLSGAAGVFSTNNTGAGTGRGTGAPLVPQTGAGMAPPAKSKAGVMIAAVGAVAVAVGVVLILTLGGSKKPDGGTGGGAAAGPGSLAAPPPTPPEVPPAVPPVTPPAVPPVVPPVTPPEVPPVTPPAGVGTGSAIATTPPDNDGHDKGHSCPSGKTWNRAKKKCVRASESGGGTTPPPPPAGDIPAWKKCPTPVPGDNDCDGIPDVR